ncbi:MAG: hypothetical protein ORN51_12620 [Akkermansiaceae bacterium]|jgi:hypothetical protein|nr:hypothetical protein [Akkermansiaceae bacterium]
MTAPKITMFLLFVFAMGLVSCATHHAVPATQTPATNTTTPDALPGETALPELPDDGIRMPDLFGMPSSDDFRSSHSPSARPEGSGSVISRPPTDPPSRVKPDITPPQ